MKLTKEILSERHWEESVYIDCYYKKIDGISVLLKYNDKQDLFYVRVERTYTNGGGYSQQDYVYLQDVWTVEHLEKLESLLTKNE